MLLAAAPLSQRGPGYPAAAAVQKGSSKNGQNQDQGPLMHMEVTEDPESWTNRVVRDFYRKSSVVEVERAQEKK